MIIHGIELDTRYRLGDGMSTQECIKSEGDLQTSMLRANVLVTANICRLPLLMSERHLHLHLRPPLVALEHPRFQVDRVYL